MRFRKLRVAGFKSFVEPAELLIEPGLTGLVGPNGCGKSNLLEAMRWVMGEGSARALRGGGMEDVIFAGTVRRPPRAFAEVSLLVDGTAGEREVVRRIERGAGSAYRIDGKDVRARDVSLLFADAATGAHSPALVGQGRIAAVIAAKPAERRQMLEDAAGIAGLHVRRREAEGKLRATEDNLRRLAELMGDADSRLASLRRQARAATRYRQLSADLAVAAARALFARWRQAAVVAEQAAADARTAEQAARDAAGHQRAAATAATEAGRALGTARTAATAARDRATEQAQALDRLARDRATVARRLAELAARRDQIGRDRAREQALIREAGAAGERLGVERDGLAVRIAAAEAEAAGLAGDAEAAERAARSAEAMLAAVRARLAAEEGQVRIVQAGHAAARARVARALAERDRADREAAGHGDDAPWRASLDDAKRRQAEADAEATAAASALAAAEAAREAAVAALERAENQSAAARAAVAAADSEARALGAALAKAKGTPMLDRIRVAPGLERALAAALGDDLDAPLGGDGPRGWVGAAPEPDDPPLADGLASLDHWVEGAPALARRLAQVGVAAVDAGEPLRVGQRLVTRDGVLRRWDGYVARGAGAAAAERLIRANRLAELDRELPGLRAAADAARRNHEQVQAAQRVARATADRARADGAAAEQRLRLARRDEDAAQAAIDRRAAALRSIGDRRVVLEREREEAAAGETDAARAVAALPDIAAGQTEQARARADAMASQARLTDLRARLVASGHHLARDRQRLQASESEAAGWRARGADASDRVAGHAARLEQIDVEEAPLLGKPAALDGAITERRIAAAATASLAAAAAEGERVAATALATAEAAAAHANEALADARERRAGAAARADHADARRSELSGAAGERFGCSAPLLPERIGFEGAAVQDPSAETARHDRLAAERDRLGAVNLVAEQELAELEGSRATALAQQAEIAEAVARLRGQVGALNREGRERLRTAFHAVDGHFRRLFSTLFVGGEAHLALVDADDPLEAGLEIMAQPPGKRLGSLALLSGGEQALTAVALVFALFLTAPAPICVLDEVDAPLDDANIERFCDLLAAMTHETDTRYLVVTHNPLTMARMARLFGVTMVEPGVSRLVSVDLGGAEALLASAD